MSSKYNFSKIESNWRDKWYKNNVYEAVDFSKKPKKYILAELPYPSGKSLHVGHAMRYTVPEMYSRYLRMKGFNVMFPMGWDSFGLPTEVFAIQEGKTPQEVIAQATKDYKKAMQDFGYAIDWNREFSTSDPSYYKWTQWIFLKLWEKGFAKVREMPVWWCEELGVLADEEVIQNKNGEKISEKGGHKVERKMFKQWVLKIPEYADKLIEGLIEVDFQESIKTAQLNWIGRKEGTMVQFDIDGEKEETFTTRPDTLYGVTFMAVAPEHPLVKKALKKIKNKKEIEEYVKKAKSLSDLEKQTKEKTGVRLEGIYAKHPLREIDMKIPVFVADYILLDYGTGVVMGVPGHDERDFDFAKKYNLEVIEVIKPEEKFEGKVFEGIGKMINSGEYDGVDSEKFKETITNRLVKENKGRKGKMYRMRDQVWSRQHYWGDPIPLIHTKDGKVEADDNLPLKLPEVKKGSAKKGEAFPPLSTFKDWEKTKDSKGNEAKRETDTMPTWAGSNWYYMRYIDPKNDKEFADFEKLKYWMPIDKYFGGSEHTTVHLLYSRFWYRFLFDQGLVPTKEPYQWRMNGGLMLGPDGYKMSKSQGNIVNPQEVMRNYGADATRMYIAFIGPYEDTYPWNENGIKACFRLTRVVYEMKDSVTDEKVNEGSKINKNLHKLIKNVSEMMEKLKMNTAVSEIMIFSNHLKKEEKIPIDIWKDFIKVLAPFAPFLAEELWQEINGYKSWEKENSVHLQGWPKFDEKITKDDLIELPIQINGKLRVTINVSADLSKDEVEKKVLDEEKVKTYLGESKVKKIIYVPNKIVNIVL